MKDFHFDAISAFENYEIEQMRDGHVVVTTKVVDSSDFWYKDWHGVYGIGIGLLDGHWMGMDWPARNWGPAGLPSRLSHRRTHDYSPKEV